MGGLAFSAALTFAQSVNPYNSAPTRTVGQARQTPVTSVNPNYPEGRELLAPQSVAADTSTNPPTLYVADTGNNRVLAWRDPANAAKGAPADFVIGQRDFFTTLGQGPASPNTELRINAGFSTPTGITVDRAGNLYVADAGNNRVLRFPRPAAQENEIKLADLVIGQRSISSGSTANQGIGPTNRTLSFAPGSVYRVGLAVDPAGNLWVSDPGNNRVLRFPVAQLAPNTLEPTADLVLGQTDFSKTTVVDPPGTVNLQLNKAVLFQPSGLAFDSSNRLYIADARQRVTMWQPPFSTGMSASRVLGTSSDPGLSAQRLGSTGGPPEAIYFIGSDVLVSDSSNNRILRYGPPESWAGEDERNPSPAATLVYGQPDFTQNQPNRGIRGDTRADALANPLGGVVADNFLWIADSGNHRVIGMPVNSLGTATRVLGQQDFQYRGPNRVKRQGLNFVSSLGSLAGIAVDFTSDPPPLYIADSGNNRVLGFRDARNVRVGDLPDLVIGQMDFERSTLNYSTGDPNAVLERGFNAPGGVAVDPDGNLWVADTGNGRVMRFPKPFAQEELSNQRANLCLGQANCFATPQKEATSRTMAAPLGIAFMVNGNVLVSDAVLNRVLQFRKGPNGDFTDGQAAFLVVGQRDFSLSAVSADPDRLNTPRNITIDSSDRLYIADTGNNRIFVRALVGLERSGPQASYLLGTSAPPTAVNVSRETGNIWVTFPSVNQLVRFPEYQSLVFDPSPQPAGDVIPSFAPLNLTLDPQDNPIVAEGINRVAFYYPRVDLRNSANKNRRLIAPGMIALVSRVAGTFGDVSGTTPDDKKWPKDLGDIEVLVDETPSALRSVAYDKIEFQIPTNFDAPKEIELVVRRKSSGQILGAIVIPTEVASPGFFSKDESGVGQVLAINDDGTNNDQANGATRGSTVRLFGTGIGKLPNMPPDGEAVTTETPAPSKPTVVFNSRVLSANDIKYWGLAPGFVGMFRLDVVVPPTAAVNFANPVGIEWRDLLSRDPFAPGVNVTVWVR
ncbi:hypothetical protein F183_A48890 [Bryobacterales bacterium F-183]|nr:hypothetical protein F183_A48890 [Bryobacterales bacterium F-183]